MSFSLNNHPKGYSLTFNEALLSAYLPPLSASAYAARHGECAKLLKEEGKSAWGHRTIQVLEYIPIVGLLVAAIERICAFVHQRFFQDKQEEGGQANAPKSLEGHSAQPSEKTPFTPAQTEVVNDALSHETSSENSIDPKPTEKTKEDQEKVLKSKPEIPPAEDTIPLISPAETETPTPPAKVDAEKDKEVEVPKPLPKQPKEPSEASISAPIEVEEEIEIEFEEPEAAPTYRETEEKVNALINQLLDACDCPVGSKCMDSYLKSSEMLDKAGTALAPEAAASFNKHRKEFQQKSKLLQELTQAENKLKEELEELNTKIEAAEKEAEKATALENILTLEEDSTVASDPKIEDGELTKLKRERDKLNVIFENSSKSLKTIAGQISVLKHQISDEKGKQGLTIKAPHMKVCTLQELLKKHGIFVE